MNALVALTVIIILVNIIVLDSSDCLCNASLRRERQFREPLALQRYAVRLFQ